MERKIQTCYSTGDRWHKKVFKHMNLLKSLTSTLSLVYWYIKWVKKETEKIKSYSVKLFEQATNLLDGLISFKKVVPI